MGHWVTSSGKSKTLSLASKSPKICPESQKAKEYCKRHSIKSYCKKVPVQNVLISTVSECPKIYLRIHESYES